MSLNNPDFTQLGLVLTLLLVSCLNMFVAGIARRTFSHHAAEMESLRKALRYYDILLGAKRGPLLATSLLVRHERGSPTTDYDNRWCDLTVSLDGGIVLTYRVDAEEIPDLIAQLRCVPPQ